VQCGSSIRSLAGRIPHRLASDFLLRLRAAARVTGTYIGWRRSGNLIICVI
jgi:hypothetical protein